MIGEIFYKLHTYHRYLAGGGAVLVLSAAALLLCAKSGIKWKALILSPFGVIGIGAAKVFEEMSRKIKEGGKRWVFAGLFVACLLLLAIICSGDSLVSGQVGEPVSNRMHLPGDLSDAMQGILEDDEAPRVLTMPGWGPNFMAYSSAFELMYEDPYGPDLSFEDEDQWLVYTQLSVLHPDMKKVAAAAHRAHCRYIVLSNDIWPDIPVTSFGYEPFISCDICTVYREVAKP